MNLQIALCLPREAETVALARRITSTTLEGIDVAQECIDDILVALSEACTNVVEHATGAEEYEVRLVVEAEQCAITVIDAGRGFDADERSRAMPVASDVRGRGVALMHALADRTRLSSGPEAGTAVLIVKELALDGHDGADVSETTGAHDGRGAE